jgi:hypothetical protein
MRKGKGREGKGREGKGRSRVKYLASKPIKDKKPKS